MHVHHVGATREGLEGKKTAAGVIITRYSVFAALPSPTMLWKTIGVLYGEHIIYIPVLDVGPWYTDDPYWTDATKRPRAEQNKGKMLGKYRINGAGIDLSDGAIRCLGKNPDDWGLHNVLWWTLN